jgi:hypothetical protein
MTIIKFLKTWESWVDLGITALYLTFVSFSIIGEDLAVPSVIAAAILYIARNIWQLIRLWHNLKKVEEPVGSMNMIDYSHY